MSANPPEYTKSEMWAGIAGLYQIAAGLAYHASAGKQLPAPVTGTLGDAFDILERSYETTQRSAETTQWSAEAQSALEHIYEGFKELEAKGLYRTPRPLRPAPPVLKGP